jgi:hypothetical protein
MLKIETDGDMDSETGMAWPSYSYLLHSVKLATVLTAGHR